jgi:hypothetical protein
MKETIVRLVLIILLFTVAFCFGVAIGEKLLQSHTSYQTIQQNAGK